MLVLAALAALPAPAQDNSTAIAVDEAVLRQANTIVLRQKLAEARSASLAGETASAAKLYQEACELCQQIGSGIDAETAQAINGLAGNRLALARDAQAAGICARRPRRRSRFCGWIRTTPPRWRSKNRTTR